MKEISTTGLKALIVGADTHEGETGKNNEDSYGFFAFKLPGKKDTVLYLGLAADGIGGHQAGERASQLGVSVVRSHFRQATSPDLLRHLEKAFQAANSSIVNEGKKSAQYRGMGTTMTAAAIVDDRLFIANVGDSRAYLIRDQAIHQLSIDHTWAQEAIEAGRLTPEQAKSHPNRNVIKRYMGIQSDMEVDFRVKPPEDGGRPSEDYQGLRLKRGDVVLLCSDGLSDLVPDPDILAAVVRYEPQQAAEQLVKMARASGGYDNITVVAMKVPGKPTGGLWKRLALAGASVVAVAAVAAAAVFALQSGLLEPKPTATVEPTPVPATPTPTLTDTPTPTSTPSPQPTATQALATTEVPAGAATPTSVPTRTPTNTFTPVPPTPTPTETATATPTTEAPAPGPKPPKPPKPTDTPAPF